MGHDGSVHSIRVTESCMEAQLLDTRAYVKDAPLLIIVKTLIMKIIQE